MEEEERTEGFKVTDKRRFTDQGENKLDEHASSVSEDIPEQPAPSEERSTESAERSNRSGDQRKAPPPPMDFTTFVISLANTALFQLGLVKGSESDEPKKDLAGARQTIDLLALMEEKTRGNLTDQEQKILAETLFQLRMVFVEASK